MVILLPCDKSKLQEHPKTSSTKVTTKVFTGRELNSKVIILKMKQWAIRSQSPKVDKVRLWRRFNDYMDLGLKELTIPHESLRDSLVPG